MNTRAFIGILGVALATSLPMAAACAALLVEANGTGSLVITAVDATTLQETITIPFTTTAGPPLTSGVLATFIDLTATSIETTLFDAKFTLTGPGGDGLFGTYSLTSSVFSSPVDETFTGAFYALGGSGAYAGYSGSGTFSGTNVYSDPSLPTAITNMSVSGILMVPEPPTEALLGFGTAAIVVGRAAMRRRRKPGPIAS